MMQIWRMFLFTVVAIAAGVPPNWQSTHFVLLSVSSSIIYQYKTTIYKQIQSESAEFFNTAVGPKLSFKPKSN